MRLSSIAASVRIPAAVAALGAFAWQPVAASAQATTADVAGLVVDAQSALPIPGATAVLKQATMPADFVRLMPPRVVRWNALAS